MGRKMWLGWDNDRNLRCKIKLDMDKIIETGDI